ncbi:hypothetical protein [Piscibacillus salipiscarius]|uniref:hypothetical protein n=1 Tax=Piscibacillus salipiscarius TaxID=299480 RepID=UPI0006D20880|nr:hypothetical protein [Piscibacillus salipiscarius]
MNDHTYVITGSLDTKNCGDAEIGSLFLNGPLTVKSSSLIVNGTAVLNSIEINTLTQAIIKGNAYINSTLTSGNNPNSLFLACGHARFKQKIDYKGNFSVRGYVITDDDVIFSHNPVVFGSDAILKNGLILHGTDLTVDGNLTIYVNTSSEEFSHTQFGGDIYVSGDLIIKTEDGETIVNPAGNSFHTNADVQTSFPECENAPPLETTSEPVVTIEDGSY